MAEALANLDALGISLPSSVEAERAVLGAILLDERALSDVSPILQPDYFYSKSNSEIFRIMLLLSNAGNPVDLVTVLNEVVRAGVFADEQEAKVYLYQIFETAPNVSNAVNYAGIVSDKYVLRSLLYAARDIIGAASEGAEPTETLLDYAEQKIYAIRKGKTRREMVPLAAAAMEEIEYLTKIMGPDRQKYLGLETGYKYLDRKLSGLNRSDLIILAARPSVGKTSFALNIASNIMKNYPDTGIAVFSLEMSNRQLAERMLCAEAQISMSAMRGSTLEGSDWRTIVKAAGDFSNSKLYLDDTSVITVNEMKGKCRRIDNLGLVIVDYLQLMSSGRRADNRVAEITELTRNFKIMAKEMNVPILLLSQLSRESEKQKRRPILSDLRDSGSIEQDADIVLFLHRNSDEEMENGDRQAQHECIIAKNRHGEVGLIPLDFDGAYTRFSSVEMTVDE